MSRATVVACVLTVAILGACSDDDDDDATGTTLAPGMTVEEAVAAVCDEGESYVRALDAYGSLLSGEAPTVGDVQSGASDLDAADDDLQDAITDLQQATAAAEVETGSTVPEVDDETIDRVHAANDAFNDAVTDVDPATPLDDAAIEVESSAYALQVAWALALADLGCVDDPSAAQASAAAFTRGLQEDLAEAGRYTGPIDGIYGPDTVEAVESLQADAALPVTGVPDRATAEALAAELDRQELVEVAALQSMLAATGFYTGPIDGVWSTAVSDAVAAFQADAQLEPTGAVDPATLHALALVIASLSDTTTTTTPTTTPTTTTSSSTTTSTTTTVQPTSTPATALLV